VRHASHVVWPSPASASLSTSFTRTGVGHIARNFHVPPSPSVDLLENIRFLQPRRPIRFRSPLTVDLDRLLAVGDLTHEFRPHEHGSHAPVFACQTQHALEHVEPFDDDIDV
jgi:hypothetical protein